MRTSGKTDDRQPWLKRVLIPFWVFQSLFMVILIGFSAWIISYKQSSNPTLVLIFACINTTLILSEIFLFVRQRLQPLLYLILQTIKTSLWAVLFGMGVVDVVGNSRQGSPYSPLDLFTSIVQVTIVLLSFLGTLIYASVIYRRHRRGTPYHRSRPKPSSSLSSSFIPLATEHPSPSTDYTAKTPHYDRASTTAPENDERMTSHNNNNDQKIGELDYRDTEIREMYSPEEEEVMVGIGYDGEKWRELQGDERVFEMRADRSVKGSRRATGVDGQVETR
ncbi:hypothetical protein XPA_003278 [Xanthoria parietina]